MAMNYHHSDFPVFIIMRFAVPVVHEYADALIFPLVMPIKQPLAIEAQPDHFISRWNALGTGRANTSHFFWLQ